MATSPSRAAFAAPTGNYTTTTSPKVTTTGIDFAVGDWVIIAASSEQAGTNSNVTPVPSAGAFTWTLPSSSMVGTTNQSGAKMWAGRCTTAATNVTFSLARINTSTTLWWGFTATKWTGVTAVNALWATAPTSGTANSVAQAVTTLSLQANSGVQIAFSDWNAVNVTAPRSYQTVNGAQMAESLYVNGASHATAYGAYREDVGAAGTKTVGLTTPATLRWVMVGVELVGTTAAGGTTYAAAGTVSAASAIVGAAAAVALAAGSVAAVTTATGAASVAPRVYATAGTVAATTTTTGAASSILPGSSAVNATSTASAAGVVTSPTGGLVAGVSTARGAAQVAHSAGSLTAATSTAYGAGSILGGPAIYSTAGVVAATSTTSGRAVVTFAASGRVAGSATITGSASVIAGPVVHQASGFVTGAAATTGTATYIAGSSGFAAVTSGAVGSVSVIDPDFVPPVLEVGPAVPPRFTAAAARESTVTATQSTRRYAAVAEPPRYRSQP